MRDTRTVYVCDGDRKRAEMPAEPGGGTMPPIPSGWREVSLRLDGGNSPVGPLVYHVCSPGCALRVLNDAVNGAYQAEAAR